MDNRPNQVPDASFPSHPGDEGETNHPGAFFPPSAPSFVPTPSNSMHHCEAIPYNSPGLPALAPSPVQSYDSGFSTPAHPPVPSSLSMPPQQRYQEPQGQQPVPSPISIPRRQQDQEQQHPQWQQHPQGQQQQGQQTVLMPMICDGCSRSPELRGKCNRQYPCCYTCDQEHKACTYTRIPPGCKLCKNAGRNCDRTMPRCSDCQAQGLLCYDDDLEPRPLYVRCNQCQARRAVCHPRGDTEPCEYCHGQSLLCSFKQAKRPSRLSQRSS